MTDATTTDEPQPVDTTHLLDMGAVQAVGITVHADDPKPPEQHMAMAEDTHGYFAVVVNGVVINVIIIDTADQETLRHFADLHEELVLITNPGAGSPGMGWRQSAPGQPLVPPPTLTTDDDGENSPVTLTYTDALAANETVEATALGHTETVTLDASGVGTVKITRPAEGVEPVEVSVGGQTAVVGPALPPPPPEPVGPSPFAT